MGIDFYLDYRERKAAEAALFAKKAEAEGITEMAKAYSAMANVFGGPQGLLQYLMLQNNTYEKLALANAQAINGLQPKISVWNTGMYMFIHLRLLSTQLSLPPDHVLICN